MKKITFSLCFLFGFFLSSNAQINKEETLMTIAGRDISVGEFERIYNKNNNDYVAQKQTVEEYLDMFINFKLIVIEAEEMGMDTLSSFKQEFRSYKKQLAKPYMTDTALFEKFAKNEYKRLCQEINARHIMIRLEENPTPEDTLKAYEKLIEIRNKILDGEDFETLARATSDDPKAKTNGGDLGWFSAFDFPLEMEDLAFSTDIGDITLPFRTRFGMHIMKIYDKRKALGSVKVAHIFIAAPSSMNENEAEKAKEKALRVMDSLQKGVEFKKLTPHFSDDRSTALNGGELPWFKSGDMIPEFESAAFSLITPGSYSEPFRSAYGWHIIKLLDKEPIKSYEDEKAGIYDKLNNTEWSKEIDKTFISSLKSEYNYQVYNNVLLELTKRIDTTFLTDAWEKESISDIANEALFSLDEKKFTVNDFIPYLKKRLRKKHMEDLTYLVQQFYQSFENEKILEYEEDNLVNKHEDYKYILQEYHDGILLFDLTDQRIYSKVINDSIGLQDFYDKNKKEYMWEKRAEVYHISILDSSLTNQVIKYTNKLISKRKFSEKALLKQFCKDDTTGNCIKIEYALYEKGDNAEVDKTNWEKGAGELFYSEGIPSFVVVNDILKPSVKEIKDTKGQLISDYEKYLKDLWIKELRDKYQIKINEELLKQIKN